MTYIQQYKGKPKSSVCPLHCSLTAALVSKLCMQLHVTWVTVISHITHKIRREASQKSPKATHCEYVVKLFFRFSFCSAPSKRDRQVTTIIFRTMRQRHGRRVWLWVFRIWTTLMTLCKHKKVDWFFQKLLKLIEWCRLPSSANWINHF